MKEKITRRLVAIILSIMILCTSGGAVSFAETVPYDGMTTQDYQPDTGENPDEVEIDGVKINVSAPEGVFPEGAVLSVMKVPEGEQEKVDRALEEARDADKKVAASYTFDIKVLAADGVTELEPADAAGVEVSFSLAQPADPNLEPAVYHVTESQDSGELSAEKMDIIKDGSDNGGADQADSDNTVTVETDGFSYFTLELTSSIAKRTILLYDCGTDLETDGAMATYNLRQILKSKFSANNDVRFIIMTGGTDKWHLEKENLVFPDDVYVPNDAVAIKDPRSSVTSEYSEDPRSEISNVYNQIWEAKGADAAENPGKMVLVDGDGVLGDGETAKRSMISADDYDPAYGFDLEKEGNYEWMNWPKVLKAFINYGVDHYPAEKYDLILWDHGGGPTAGFCSNQQDPAHGLFSAMTISEMADAFADNKVVDPDGDGIQDGTFDFIDFDACLMGGVENTLAFGPYMDYYIASPETEPGYGQYYGPCEGQYTGWLDALGQKADMDTYELGRIIVDDFIKFYDKESGDGSSQEGTLAVIDMKKLLKDKVEGKTFLEALSLLDQNLDQNLRSAKYYDEFRSFKNAIAYSDETYHDLGNLLSQLAYEYDDLDYQAWKEKDGNIDSTNAYTDIAKILMGFLCDEAVMYARSSKGIHTNKQFYMDKNGNMQYGEQPTSGLYIWFDPKEDPTDRFGSHHMYMYELIEQMQKKDPDDPIAAFFDAHLRTVEKYGIAYFAGKAVSDMISAGTDPEQINYDAVRKYWETHYNNSEFEPLDEVLTHFYDRAGGEGEVKGWLETLIREMRIEVVQADKIQTQPVRTDGGTGYRITLNEVRKQAIDSVKMNVIAELPALRDFLNAPEHASYVERFKDKSPGVTIGTLSGKEVIDIDPEQDGFNKTVDWLFDPTSTWALDPPETKWYALRDAEGKLHVTAAEYDEEEMDIPTGYVTWENLPTYDAEYNFTGYSMQEVWHLVWLIFKKDGSGNWNLEGMAFQQDTGYRVIETKDYLGDYELYPVLEFGNWGELVPISYEPFKLTPETVSSLKPEYMDLDQIGRDVADIDGDGSSSHNTVTVMSIYEYETDITEKINNPTEAEVTPEEEAAQNVEDARTAVQRAQEAVDALADDASAQDIKDAYEELIRAQQALADAQEALKEILSDKEKAKLQDEIEKLNKEVKNLNDQLAETQVVDISFYAATLSGTSFEYTGKAIRPSVTVPGLNANDYTVKYANNTKIGTATVTISAKGDKYKGTITRTFTITRKTNPLSVKGKTAAVKKNKVKKKAQKLKVTKVIKFTRKGQGKVTYAKVSGNKRITINKKTGKVTVKKGLKKGNYKVKVKVTAAGNKTFKKAVKTVTFKIKVK